MPTRVRRRSSFTFLLLPLMFCAVAAYFGWQGTRGDFSQEARATLSAERASRERELAALVKEREAMEAKVAGLRSDRLDADLLDERARAQLNLAHPKEIVIFHGMNARPGGGHSGPR